MQNYIVIKELPDANIGTKVIYNEEKNLYFYDKNSQVEGHNFQNYLTEFQVTNMNFFCPESQYAEYFGYNNPVLSRFDVLELLKKHFKDGSTYSIGERCYNKEFHKFEEDLRELTRQKAEKTLNLK